MSAGLPGGEDALERVGAIAIVGASLAGLAAARAFREEGFRGEVVVFSAEPRAPYDRPPLSKAVLRADDDEEGMIELLQPTDEESFELRLGARVTGFDEETFRLQVDGAWTEPFPGGIVIATGSTPRTWPDAPEGVYTLRTHADAMALRRELRSGHREVVVVGGGFIGAEVAASARELGLEVTVVEVDEVPFARILGEPIGRRIVRTHEQHGVRFVTGVGVAGLEGERRVSGVRLVDGRVLPADLVVVGIGVLPEVAWLAGTSVPVGDGVMCDETLSAGHRIVAAGDVAHWPNGLTGERRRVEHWDNAIRQGRHAARRLLADHGVGRPDAFQIMPWVWSDQFEMKLQMVGATRDPDEIAIVHGTLDDGKFVALYRRGDRLAGAFCMNRVKALMGYREMLERGVSWAEALQTADAAAARV